MNIDLPNDIVEFLHRNPYPSLSYLPTVDLYGNTSVTFFYQDTKRQLISLLNESNMNISFYEEPDAYIMRLELCSIDYKKTKYEGHLANQVEVDFPYIETEFMKKLQSNIDCLKNLLNQEQISFIHYDKTTNYINQNIIDFKPYKPRLKEFLLKENI